MVKDIKTYEKIKLIGNKHRFEIMELVLEKELTVTEISSKLDISYNRCRDYITMLFEKNLVSKKIDGRNTYIKAKFKTFLKEI